MISFTTVTIFEFTHVLVFLLLGDVLFFNESGTWLVYNIAMLVYIGILIFLSKINRGEEPELSALESIRGMDRFLFYFSRDNTLMYIIIYAFFFGIMLAAGKFIIRMTGLYFP